MVKVAADRHIPDQVSLLRQRRQVLKRVSGLHDVLLVDLKVRLLWWLDYWLSQRLGILLHDQCLDVLPKDLVSIWVVLLVLMEYDLVSMLVVVFLILVHTLIDFHQLVLSG